MIEPSERQFQDTVIEALELFGWRCIHHRPAQDRRGRWKTAMIGSPGWPDLIAVRGGWLLALELKSEKGLPTTDQLAWLADLAKVPGVIASVVKPSDWPWLEQVMRHPERAGQEGLPR